MSTTTTDHQLSLELRSLPPEPWGERLRRARDIHGFTQERAAERLADFLETTGATISRLESLNEVPKTPKRRHLAWALCASYGVDPTDLGLTDDDRPPLVIVTAIFGRTWDDLGEAPEGGQPRIHAPSGSVQLSVFDLAECA